MPAMPGTRLAMVEPRLAFGGLKAFLDRPSQPSDRGQFVQLGEVRPERHVEGQISRIDDRSSDQQPVIPWRRLQPQQTEPSPVVEAGAFRTLASRQTPPLTWRQAGGEFLGGVRVKVAHHQPLVAANAQNIGLLAALEHDAQTLVAAVDRVAQDPRTGNARLQRRLDHCGADLRLGGEPHIVGNARPRPTLGSLGPIFRQIQTRIDQGVSFRTRIAEKNADLTVLDPSGRAAVLTRNPDRMAALLHKPRLVQDQDAAWIAKPLDHKIPADVPGLLLIP